MCRTLEEEQRDGQKLDALIVEYKRLFAQIPYDLKAKLNYVQSQIDSIKYKYI